MADSGSRMSRQFSHTLCRLFVCCSFTWAPQIVFIYIYNRVQCNVIQRKTNVVVTNKQPSDHVFHLQGYNSTSGCQLSVIAETQPTKIIKSIKTNKQTKDSQTEGIIFACLNYSQLHFLMFSLKILSMHAFSFIMYPLVGKLGHGAL